MTHHVRRSRDRGHTVPRRVCAALAGVAVAALVGAPAVAEDATASPEPTGAAPTAAIGPQTAGTTVCTVNNADLDEITGMVATPQGIYAVESGVTFRPFAVEIWTIDSASCAATSETYGFPPIDPQDLALGSDGALWVADVGNQDSSRDWLTMERVDLASGADAVPYRALMPATGAISATAVIMDADNTPIIIANSGSQAVLYKPSGPMPADATEDLPTLTQVGAFTPVNTDTETPRGAFGRTIVTGAAVSPDRGKVVLRTESDAYEFTVGAGSDIVTAITQGTPTITPLPGEENGQAITYSADGSRFLTLSSVLNPTLRAYTPYVPPADTGGGVEAPSGGGNSFTFGDLTLIASAIGFVGFLAVAAGVVGIVLHRRKYPAGAYPDPRSQKRRARPDWDDADEYGGHDNEEHGRRPGRPPRPRDDGGEPWPEESRPGRATARVAPGGDDYGRSYGAPSSGPDADHGAQGPRARPGGQTHSPDGGGGGGGQVYGSSASAGATAPSGGTGSGGSSGRVYGTARPPGSSGGVYGRPRDPDEEDRGRYDDRRGHDRDGYEDRRGQDRDGYEDRRGGYEERRGGYDDRRGGYDDRRGYDRDDDEPRRGGYGRDNVDL